MKKGLQQPGGRGCEVAFQASFLLQLEDCPEAAGGEEGGRGAGSPTCHVCLSFTLFLQLGWKFYDADDYHPEENRMKMRNGIPLNDQVMLAISNTNIPAGRHRLGSLQHLV